MKRSPLIRKAPDVASLSVPVPKSRKCKVCSTPFMTTQSFRSWCSPQCGSDIAAAKLAKQIKAAATADKVRTRAALEALKTLSQLADEAQREVNRYVRIRDAHEGCISCSKPATWPGKWDAGHLRTRGASPATRFVTWAIRKQCVECNRMRSGNAAEMYRRMVPLVGQEKLDWLYAQNTPAKFTRAHLIRLKAVFRKKANRMAERKLNQQREP